MWREVASTAIAIEHMIPGMKASMFVLAVVPFHPVESPARYLVVEERDGTFYLPAGRVERGENLVAAVVRETIEEAKQLIGVLGMLAMDHEVRADTLRLRFVFAGYRGLDAPVKREADHHSRGAAYMTREQIARLPLRHPEVLTFIDAYESRRSLMPTGAYDFYGPDPVYRED
jgi:ADP-ribose pyrophosphatase YjhB (NUDIX family)